MNKIIELHRKQEAISKQYEENLAKLKAEIKNIEIPENVRKVTFYEGSIYIGNDQFTVEEALALTDFLNKVFREGNDEN